MRNSIKILALLVIWGVILIKCFEHNLISLNMFNKQNFTNKEVEDVFYEVCRKSGECSKVLKFSVNEDETINAYALNGEVVFFRGLINKLKTKDEIALIAGHEIAHILLHHSFLRGVGASTLSTETQADKYGAMLAMLAGYDVCKGKGFMKVLQQEFGDEIESSHPDWSFRYDQLNVNCDK